MEGKMGIAIEIEIHKDLYIRYAKNRGGVVFTTVAVVT